MKSKLIVLTLALAVVAVAASIAVGSSGNRTALADPSSAKADETIAEAFPSFGEEPSQSEDISALRKLHESFADPTSSNPAARADFESARVVPMFGGDAPAWIAPSGDRVCIYIPDPTDGFGAGCVTLKDIREGHGFSFLGSSRESYVVALVPEGDSAPKVASDSEPDARMTTTGNASAGLLPSDAVITTANATIDLANGAGPVDRPAP